MVARKSVIINAKRLRDKNILNNIPGDRPGWYCWWAPGNVLKLLLNSKYISREYFDKLLLHLSKKKINGIDHYCFYVGVAIKESIRGRLDWHVNQKHNENNVFYGTLSTLRQSISSLMAGNQMNEKFTNLFIDMCLVEYYVLDEPIKSQSAKLQIEKIEHELLNKTTLPINIQCNHNVFIKEYKKELQNARKKAKLQVANSFLQ